MAEFRMTERIDRPLPEVFRIATDLEHATEWVPGVKNVEVITPGTIGVGTHFRETRACGKREATSVIEITAYEPERRYSAGAAFPGGQATYHYHFKPEQGATRVDLVAEIRGRGLGWLLVPLLTMALKKNDADHLQRLKAFIEKRPAGVA